MKTNYNEKPPHTLEWLSTRQVITSVGEVGKKMELSFTAVGNVNWYRHYGKHYGRFSKIKNSVTM